MPQQAALDADVLSELQSALNHGNVARRVETLRRITDLFLYAPQEYSDDQLELFDDVFRCLIEKIETSAKALLAARMASVPHAPPQLMQTLAFDDLIEVAAPVLSHSERLNDEILVKTARAKSQDHLLAISKRRVLSGAVTDVLVERGNDTVLEATLKNPGAEFSDSGVGILVTRVEHNDALTECLGLRPIPRHHYLKLVVKASETVRARLQRANPQLASDVRSAVKEAAVKASEARTEDNARALQLVESLHRDGRLDEIQVASFAEKGRFDEVTAAIATLTNVPMLTVENMMLETRSEGLLVLAKVGGLSWATLEKILSVRRDTVEPSSQTDVDNYRDSYDMLRNSTAQQVLRFYRMRERTEPT